MVRKNKRGQVTLFVILAILIVAAIGILFHYLKPDFFSQGSSGLKLENCFSGSLDAKIKTLGLTAGLINPKFNQRYLGKNYTFLCYTAEYYQPCVNQEPFLTQAFEKSLARVLEDEFQSCYDASVDELRNRGYEVRQGDAKFNISIEPGEIKITVDAPTEVSSGQAAVQTQKYSYRYQTNLYEVLMVAVSLVQFETFYGDSEQTTQMFYYPNVVIDKQRLDDDTKVYTLTEKNERIKYLFAVRSYPYPAGGNF